MSNRLKVTSIVDVGSHGDDNQKYDLVATLAKSWGFGTSYDPQVHSIALVKPIEGFDENFDELNDDPFTGDSYEIAVSVSCESIGEAPALAKTALIDFAKFILNALDNA